MGSFDAVFGQIWGNLGVFGYFWGRFGVIWGRLGWIWGNFDPFDAVLGLF